MKLVHDNRRPEILEIERLLYGYNYQVWLNVYGPFDNNHQLRHLLRVHVSPGAKVRQLPSVTGTQAKDEIRHCLLYEGYSYSGPIQLAEKKSNVLLNLNHLFAVTDIDRSFRIVPFIFTAGHPAYPVFWDFAYRIQTENGLWIFIGSGSD